ncbi:MAG TPA: ATP-grasp domain-containing protein [Oligoflexia bacterium]|nr:ATP-grasp domain-containing protein [Oligoflexia bacterium]HMR24297.1 ATP-grasp domain-containing protein [Oligoflexia bacterium]
MKKYKKKAIVIVDPVSTGYTLVKIAKEKGLMVIAVITLPQACIKGEMKIFIPYADDILKGRRHTLFDEVLVDTYPDSIVNKLKKMNFQIQAVIPGSEVGVESASYIASMMNLPANDPKKAEACRNKYKMKKLLRNSGLEVGNSVLCHKNEVLFEVLEEFTFPVILKTPSGGGSHLVFSCLNMDQAKKAHDVIVNTPDCWGRYTQHSLIEEYIGGHQYAVNLFGDGLDTYITDIWSEAKSKMLEQKNICTDNILQCSSSWSKEVESYAKQVCSVLGIKVGPVHLELRVTNDGPKLIEVAARFCGAKIPEQLSKYSNFNPIEACLQVFSGEKNNIPQSIKYKKMMSILFLHSTKKGVFKGIKNLQKIKHLSSYDMHVCIPNQGDLIYPTVSEMNIPAVFWFAHHDANMLKQDHDRALKLLEIEYA